jgi:hypothetical protein
MNRNQNQAIIPDENNPAFQILQQVHQHATEVITNNVTDLTYIFFEFT